jgi:hypothetical protein
MKKTLFLALACLATSWQSLSAEFCAIDGYDSCYSDCFDLDSVLTFDVGGGYRKDNLKWKIFPSFDPGRQIEERWNNIGLGVVEANAQLLAFEQFLLMADFNYGWFSNNGTQKVFARGGFDETVALRARPTGNVCDISGGLGYQFNWNCARISFAPLVGYSYHQQRLKGRAYRSLITLDGLTLAHNNYRFRWSGPWVGFALAYQATCELQLYLDYSYHWARFRGNIKEHFVLGQLPTHLRSNRAYGNEFKVGGIYTFCDYWYIGLKFDYKQFCGNKGKSEVEILNVKSALRSLSWNSSTITMDIGYTF